MVHVPMKEIRRKFGWTTKYLAQLLGTRPTVIGKIEAGKMRIPVKLFRPLQRIGIDPFDLSIAQEEFIVRGRNFYRK